MKPNCPVSVQRAHTASEECAWRTEPSTIHIQLESGSKKEPEKTMTHVCSSAKALRTLCREALTAEGCRLIIPQKQSVVPWLCTMLKTDTPCTPPRPTYKSTNAARNPDKTLKESRKGTQSGSPNEGFKDVSSSRAPPVPAGTGHFLQRQTIPSHVPSPSPFPHSPAPAPGAPSPGTVKPSPLAAWLILSAPGSSRT